MHCRKQVNIGNPNSETDTCIRIYFLSWLVLVLNHNASKNVRLVTVWYKDITATSLSGKTMMTLLTLCRQKLLLSDLLNPQGLPDN